MLRKIPPLPSGMGSALSDLVVSRLSPGAHARIVEEVDAAAEVERLGELDELERREKDGLLSRPVVLSLTDRGREFQEHAAVATFRSRTVGFGLERRTDHRELARRLRLVHRKVAVYAGRGRRRRRLSGRTLLLLRLLRLLLVLRMRVRLRGVRLMELAALLPARRRLLLLLRALRLVLLLLSSSLERGGVRADSLLAAARATPAPLGGPTRRSWRYRDQYWRIRR